MILLLVVLILMFLFGFMCICLTSLLFAAVCMIGCLVGTGLLGVVAILGCAICIGLFICVCLCLSLLKSLLILPCFPCFCCLMLIPLSVVGCGICFAGSLFALAIPIICVSISIPAFLIFMFSMAVLPPPLSCLLCICLFLFYTTFCFGTIGCIVMLCLIIPSIICWVVAIIAGAILFLMSWFVIGLCISWIGMSIMAIVIWANSKIHLIKY